MRTQRKTRRRRSEDGRAAREASPPPILPTHSRTALFGKGENVWYTVRRSPFGTLLREMTPARDTRREETTRETHRVVMLQRIMEWEKTEEWKAKRKEMLEHIENIKRLGPMFHPAMDTGFLETWLNVCSIDVSYPISQEVVAALELQNLGRG